MLWLRLLVLDIPKTLNDDLIFMFHRLIIHPTRVSLTCQLVHHQQNKCSTNHKPVKRKNQVIIWNFLNDKHRHCLKRVVTYFFLIIASHFESTAPLYVENTPNRTLGVDEDNFQVM